MPHGITHESVTEGARPVALLSTSVIGLVGYQETASGLAEDEMKLVREGDVAALGLDGAGTLLPALVGIFAQIDTPVVVLRIAEGVDEPATETALAGDSATRTGLWALLNAKSVTGQQPKIIIVPGHSDAAVVHAQLIPLADRLRAAAIIDGPNTDEADALTLAGAVTDADGRAYIIDPQVEVDSVAQPSSPYVAGVIAKADKEIGFWRSPSNRTINGITGIARPISFSLDGTGTEAGALNDGNVATIIRESGWRVWGNNSCSADPLYKFLVVRRIDDSIVDSIERAHLWAVDRGLTATFLDEITDSVREFLRQMKNRGAIVGGDAWIDASVNTLTSLQAGDLYVDYDFTPTYPANRITFRKRLTSKYLASLFAS
jgi:phage tail sheath protein FI